MALSTVHYPLSIGARVSPVIASANIEATRFDNEQWKMDNGQCSSFQLSRLSGLLDC
jgi:hypothetical protein